MTDRNDVQALVERLRLLLSGDAILAKTDFARATIEQAVAALAARDAQAESGATTLYGSPCGDFCARAAAPSREQVGEPIPGSPAFALRGLYKLATEYFIDGKPVTPDEYIGWQRGIIEALTSAKLPDPKYYGTQAGDGYQHDVKCAYVDGWNQCRSSILSHDASPSRESGETSPASPEDQAVYQAIADNYARDLGRECGEQQWPSDRDAAIQACALMIYAAVVCEPVAYHKTAGDLRVLLDAKGE